MNESFYYATCLDFLNSLLIHNLLFNKTLYTLIDFVPDKNCLKAILKQPYIIADYIYYLEEVKELLNYSGFKNTKNSDYYNKEFGLILENIHNENIITQNNIVLLVLFFM